MNKELSKQAIEIWRDKMDSCKLSWGETQLCQLPALEAMQEYADQQAKKAIEALKNIQNLLSGEPSEENAKDAYLIASDTLKLFNQQK